LIERLWELVEGVEVQKVLKDGETRIYSQPPDSFAAKTILEFRFGKAPQTLEHTAPEGFDITIRSVK